MNIFKKLFSKPPVKLSRPKITVPAILEGAKHIQMSDGSTFQIERDDTEVFITIEDHKLKVPIMLSCTDFNSASTAHFPISSTEYRIKSVVMEKVK